MTVMLMLDIAVVNTALTRIAGDLHTDLPGAQWVVDAYTLTLAALVLSAGSLADRIGRRKVLVGGLLTQHLGWRWIFLVNVPVGLLCLLLPRAGVEESGDPHARRLDVPG